MTSKIKQENPWEVRSLYEFQFFNCPDCVYINNSKQEFVIHAYESHPEIISYLKNIEDDSLSDVYCPWDINEIETKNEPIDNFQTKHEPLELLEPIGTTVIQGSLNYSGYLEKCARYFLSS